MSIDSKWQLIQKSAVILTECISSKIELGIKQVISITSKQDEIQDQIAKDVASSARDVSKILQKLHDQEIIRASMERSQSEALDLQLAGSPPSSDTVRRGVCLYNQDHLSMAHVGSVSSQVTEARSVAHTISTLSPPRHMLNDIVHESILIKVQYISSPGCSGHCLCSCHLKRSYRTGAGLQKILGELFIGCAGLPKFLAPCNILSCARPKPFCASVVYRFPTWWVKQRLLSAIVKNSSLTGTHISIRQPRLITFASYIFERAIAGDISSLTRWYDQGLITPLDIDPTTGANILLVGNLPLI